MSAIPLNVLIDAVAAMQVLREVSEPHVTPEQYMQGLRAWSALRAHVQELTKTICVEVA